MILTNEQLELTQETLLRFEVTFGELSSSTDLLKVMERDALLSTINALKEEINEYFSIINGQITIKNSLMLCELRQQLVVHRIANGLSQSCMAKAMGISKGLLIRFEATEYENVGLQLLLKASEILGNSIAEVFDSVDDRVIEIYNNQRALDIPFWELLPIKELIKRNWITAKNATSELKEVIYGSGSLTNFAYHKKTKFGERTAKEAALFAWESRILSEARKIINHTELEYVEHNPIWLHELVALSTDPNGPLLAKELLLSKGIILVIERHLDQTYLDGAALLSDEGFPVIGMTLRQDRIDNFWFVLFHELAHVYLHLLSNKFPVFLDEKIGDKNLDPLEQEANEFARNTLITPEQWASCVSPVMINENAVNIDAKNLDIHPAIIAGRIQFEKDDYSILRGVVNHGKIRALFGVK
ncbi:ImmA/IrrE family metallo-endopeptidase [Shewanella electrodiphila]|uniref:ImmA/IrrE family metallo-endopeptidase n=1 Tax=Shewanella electrodiphila TaxID=934143 RepID=A0ABT0KT28_9GAMM|nr:ImmA/IrrE family metallo-endopeptidase [Shewanella electrodiphila]MCL1047013.1 ImmA/IrrE family metallo-endopeptidase [Shewanella electrodiphila]